MKLLKDLAKNFKNNKIRNESDKYIFTFSKESNIKKYKKLQETIEKNSKKRQRWKFRATFLKKSTPPEGRKGVKNSKCGHW